MSKQIEAIYEEGRLRPLEPLALSEGDHVRLVLKLVPGDADEKLAALDSLLDACAEMTEQQWEVFEDASARRPLLPPRRFGVTALGYTLDSNVIRPLLDRACPPRIESSG